MKKTYTHFAPAKITNPDEVISITIVGCGGTGTRLISELVRMNIMLRKLDHVGLHVTVIDGDIVSDSNVGRQLYYVEDIGKQKASTTIERINRNFGFNWSAIDRYMKYSDDFDHIVYKASNFNVCCVDNVSARFEMDHIIKGPSTYRHGYHNSDQIYYHIDCGNSYDKGQVICGTTADIKQPGKGYKKRLRGIFDVFSSNDLNKASESEDKEASCSTFEALKRQDPFINSIVATYAAKIIWQLVKDHQIKHHGYFIDLEKSQPITAMSV